MKGRVLLAYLVMVSTALAGCAQRSQEFRIDEAWARPGLIGSNSAAYFTIDNPGDRADHLIGAASEVAESVELHASTLDASGTMSMEEHQAVEVPAQGQLQFQPGGLHVMLVNLTQELDEGDSFPLTLIFQAAGEVAIVVPVREQ